MLLIYYVKNMYNNMYNRRLQWILCIVYNEETLIVRSVSKILAERWFILYMNYYKEAKRISYKHLSYSPTATIPCQLCLYVRF